MRKVTFTNDYHDSSVTVEVPYDLRGSQSQIYEVLKDLAAWEEQHQEYGPHRRRLAKIRKTLCGREGCVCGVVP